MKCINCGGKGCHACGGKGAVIGGGFVNFGKVTPPVRNEFNDTERLDWVLRRGAYIVSFSDGYQVHRNSPKTGKPINLNMNGAYYTHARSAIDACMREEEHDPAL